MQEGKIREIFNTEMQGTVFLLKVTAGDFQKATISLMKNAVEQDIPIIYVSVKRPYVHLERMLRDNGISKDSVYVIDTITKTITDAGVVEDGNVSYLDSPQNLTNVGTSISVMAEKMGAENALLIFDSLEALLTYNTERDVSRFLTDLNDRTQTLEFDLALFKQDDSMDKTLGASLYSIVDKFVLVSKDETDTVYVLEQNTDHALVELPTDIARSLGWSEGDELSFTVTSSGELKLKKD